MVLSCGKKGCPKNNEKERKDFAQKPREYLIEQVKVEKDINIHRSRCF